MKFGVKHCEDCSHVSTRWLVDPDTEAKDGTIGGKIKVLYICDITGRMVKNPSTAPKTCKNVKHFQLDLSKCPDCGQKQYNRNKKVGDECENFECETKVVERDGIKFWFNENWD